MESNHTGDEKPAVDHLTFGKKTAKRVAWEAWEFTIVRAGAVQVANASYGVDKDVHTYEVTVENQDGVALPVECECPADEYNEEYDCKHKVAVATVGGPTVLQAAGAFSTDKGDRRDPATLKTDGGRNEATCPSGNSRCEGPQAEDLPCFGCYGLSEGI